MDSLISQNATISRLLKQRRKLIEIFLSHMTHLQQESAMEHIECECAEQGWSVPDAAPMLPAAPCVMAPPAK